MAPMLRSDTTALQHILAVLLDQPTTVTGSAVPPFRACFLAAGVTNATNFVSITPDTYGGIDFSTGPDGSEADSKLNVIQIKKLRSLVDWFSQVPTPPPTRWFDLDEDAFLPDLAHTVHAYNTCSCCLPCSFLPLCYFRISQEREA
jgi:hypothetical protein